MRILEFTLTKTTLVLPLQHSIAIIIDRTSVWRRLSKMLPLLASPCFSPCMLWIGRTTTSRALKHFTDNTKLWCSHHQINGPQRYPHSGQTATSVRLTDNLHSLVRREPTAGQTTTSTSSFYGCNIRYDDRM